ncbi:oligopeptide/dipeptide ABC transporter ATP-binding protein [Halovivax asiaticus JCM 14624]|uniref:Nickel import system ATP-binding protein NikD n=1 Tax=Halovivax asiaticus JCM 14624 TaxID=1227490 RepID=M0BS29_9EURY|nr:ABC transporter ATP-binding protein [Halovivax asiaticus]ELZ13811.1 oligopeptide/dipeptide ABC transporter ATP-binding protein [Halovivax asiaticus JCM 14624]
MSSNANSTTTSTRSNEPLLSVDGLRTFIETEREQFPAVDGVSFSVDRGETVCIVGESGSGKSVTCESLTGIVPQPPARITDGQITFDGKRIDGASERELRSIRGDRIAHVFQNPQQALDPVYTVGDQIVEAMTIHGQRSGTSARERAISLLRKVGIPRADDRIDEYPHEFSGGMRQRVAIAIALAADPDLLVADEPTTAVDVTVQAKLIELLRDLTDDDTAILLITHDLRVVASLADSVVVMYGGTIVERGPVDTVFSTPAHPYTQALFDSYDGLSRRNDRSARGELPSDGCRFRAECPYAEPACEGGDQPDFYTLDSDADHSVSCVHFSPDGDPERVLDASTEVHSVSEVSR